MGAAPGYSMLRPADFLPLFGDLPPYRPPGEQWQYSNAGYIAPRHRHRALTGRPYIELVQERVFDRAGHDEPAASSASTSRFPTSPSAT